MLTRTKGVKTCNEAKWSANNLAQVERTDQIDFRNYDVIRVRVRVRIAKINLVRSFGCGHMYGSARGRQIQQYKINPNPNPNPNANPSSPYCLMRFIFGSRVHVPSKVLST